MLQFDAGMGSLLSLIVWFVFGAFLVPALDGVTWQSFVFAALRSRWCAWSRFTLVLLRSGLDRSTVAFIGWFSPHRAGFGGCALVVSDALTGKDASLALSVISLTVLAAERRRPRAECTPVPPTCGRRARRAPLPRLARA